MSDVLIILAEGFEEAEAVITIDVLRRLDLDVTIASMSKSMHVTSSRTIEFVADTNLQEIQNNDYKAVVLPGGMPGSANLMNSPTVIEILQRTNSKKNLVCAICAAPIALAKAGLLKNVKFTCYPGFDEYFESTPSTDMVIKDKNIITGKGPGVAFDFALAIGEALGKDTEATAKGMLLK